MGKKSEGERHTDWNGIADFYNQFAFCELDDTRSYLEAIGVAAGDTLLDVCCGPGRVSVLAAERGAIVTGIDSAERMLAHAKENAQAVGVEDKCTFQLQDWNSVLVGQNVKLHDVVIACRCGAMMDIEKLSTLAKRTAAVQIFADAPSIPRLQGILFDGCGEQGEQDGPHGAPEGERADRPHMEGRPEEGLGGPGFGGPRGPMGPMGPGPKPSGRKPSGYKKVIDAVYDAGFDPNVRIMPERFRKTFATRDEALSWVCSLSPNRARGNEQRVAANVAPFITETETGGVEFLIATSAAIIWWDVRGKASENPWILGVAE